MWLSVLAYERGGDFVGLSPHPSLRILRGGLFMYTGIGVLMVDFIDVTHGNSGFFFWLEITDKAGIRSSGARWTMWPHHPMSVFDWRTRVI